MLADDLTALTFERCWTALPGFQPRGDSLRPWLMRIAANEVASHYRSESRRQRREHLVAVRDEPLRVDDQPDLADAEMGVVQAIVALHGGLMEAGRGDNMAPWFKITLVMA